MRISTIILAASATAAIAQVYNVPTENQGNWAAGTDVGVKGGFSQYLPGGASERTTLIDVTQAPYNADNTGATDASAAINSAISAAASGEVVYLPAGTYRADSIINIGRDNDGITLRGAGRGVTTLDCRDTQTGVMLGGDLGGNFVWGEQTVTGTKTKGTTVLTVASTSDWNVGHLGLLKIENEQDPTRLAAGENLAMSVFGEENVRSHTFLVTAKTATTLTIEPPLPLDCTDYAVVLVHEGSSASNSCRTSGVESMSIELGNGNTPTQGVWFMHARDCWLYDCEVGEVNSYGVRMQVCIHSTVRKTKIYGNSVSSTSNAGAMLITPTSCLLADNQLIAVAPNLEMFGASLNNVIAYNYFGEVVLENSAIFASHSTHPEFNLYEGNVLRNVRTDGYFGSASHDTFYRNWVHGSDVTQTEQRVAINLKRFTRKNVLAGNVIGWDGTNDGVNSYGYPNIGNDDTNGGSVTPSLGTVWPDLGLTGELTTRMSDTTGVVTMDSTVGGLYPSMGVLNNGPSLWWDDAGTRTEYSRMDVSAVSLLDVTFIDTAYGAGTLPLVNTNVEVWAGGAGWQERDLDVELSTTLDHNYWALASGTGSVQDPTGDTLPDSLAYASQPSWWTDGGFAGAWPPVNPDSPTFSLGIIPAGARYLGLAAGGTMSATSATADSVNITP